MSPRTIFCLLVLAVLGSNAPSHAASQPKSNEFIVERKEDRQKTYMESAEVNWRVVAVRQKGVDQCPEVSGWNHEDWLIQALEPQPEPQKENPYGYQRRWPKLDLRQVVADDPLLRQAGLDRFCTYTAKTDQPPEFPTQPPPAGLAVPVKSRMALVPAGEPDLDPTVILARHFLDQASGMASGMPPTVESLRANQKPVRLVFIDTQADFEGVPQHVSGTSKHGYSLVHLAKRLVCGDGDVSSCSIELATRLALPHENRNLPPPPTVGHQGGNLGLVDELAAAIVREVWNWRKLGSKENLILNLSVGWDEELLGELDKRDSSQLRPDAQRVYNAIQFARRSGALVIAAAGNHRGGEETTSPLLPAAWELSNPFYSLFAFSRKPVYAVGGVDWQGLPLSNSRRGGLPRRVAFGDHAVTQTQSPDQSTATYTGSSVSTAVVSSIAAVVWQLRPELRPAQVMRLISQSGDVLPGHADYYAWKNLWLISDLVPAPHLRRLSLCQAVKRACRGGRCSAPSCLPWDPQNGAAKLAAVVNSTRTAAMSHLPDLKAAALPPDCRSASDPSPQLFAVDAQTVADPCPLHLLPDMVSQRWVAPQPDDPPCPNCSFVPPPSHIVSLEATARPETQEGYILAAEIDSKWRDSRYKIESATLDVDRYYNGTFVNRRTYAIPQEDLDRLRTSPGLQRLLMKELGHGGSLAGCTATLNLIVTIEVEPLDPRNPLEKRTYSVQNPIYVDP